MVTPIIIQIVFWIGVVACVVGGLMVMFVIELPGPKAQQFLSGLALLLLGPVAVRVYCEVFILLFRMNETLTDIKNNTGRRP
jgi:hypothetical protein